MQPMLKSRSIRKVTHVLLHIVALYYLLPFSPLFLYYNSHQKSSNSVSEFFHENGNTFSPNKTFIKHNVSFPNKDRSRFDFGGIALIFPLSTEFILGCKNISFSNFNSTYYDSLALSTSSRGPPSA